MILERSDTSLKKHRYVKFSILLTYSILCGFFLAKHAMWRDELQLWLVASKSENIFDLISNKEYEIRPYIWFLICWIMSRFSRNPEILKIFNFGVCISLASVLLFRCKSPLVLRTMFLFGFLALFGYSAISEEYLLGTLVFIIAVSQIQNDSRKLSILLLASLLANVNLLFAIVSIGVAVIPSFSILADLFKKRTASTNDMIGILLYPVFFVFSLASMWPPRDFAFQSTSLNFNLLAVKKMSAAVSEALFPFIARNSIHGQLGTAVTYIIAIGAFVSILVLLLCSFKKSTAIGISASACMALLIVWTGIGYGNYWWHFGVVFIAYFGFTLIAIPEWKQSHKLQKFGYTFSLIVLCSQSIALFMGPNLGIFPTRTYSMARDTASYIESICITPCTILTNDEVTGASISAYLDGAEIYRVNRKDFGTFAVWDSNVGKLVSWSDLLSSAAKFQNPIFVTSNLTDPPDQIVILSEFSGGVWADEDFIVSKPNL